VSEKISAKKAKRIRWIIAIVEILVLIAVVFVLTLLLEPHSPLLATAASVVAIMLVLGFSAWVKYKYPHIFAKQDCEKPAKPNRTKKVLTTMLQAAVGFCIALGLFQVLGGLIGGHEVNYALYLGLIALGVAMIVVLITVPAVQDPEFKAEMATVKKDLRFYEKDERYIAIIYKAGYYTLWPTLAALLVFGAALAVFEVEDISVALLGILGICAAAAVLWIVLFVAFDEDKTGSEKCYKASLRGSVITFVVSLLPLGFMAVRWATTGLGGMARGFFFAFVAVSLIFLADIIMRIRLEKKG